MNDLINAIKIYAQDPENAESAYSLALLYDSIGQTASAINFYMRAAERTEDKDLAYECLLKIALCYERQGNRSHTYSVVIKHAICLLPKRPEAYFLMSRSCERASNHVDSYTFAQIGLVVSQFNPKPLRSNVEYPGRYGLTFEKAVSAWWWGKNVESRKLFHELLENNLHEMDSVHKEAVYNNISRLGSGPEEITHKKYNITKHNRLKFKFPGSENIKINFAQVYQDMFVLAALNGKRNGTYFEFGSCHPFYGNNTALLEQEFDWTGIGVDIIEDMVNSYNKERKNIAVCEDALTVELEPLLDKVAVNGVIDYLQLDCEPTKVTYDVLLRIPFDNYKFAVITYEHDHYMDMDKAYRNKSRTFLKEMGYELVVANVSPHEGSPFEDWWVHPDLIDRETINKLKCVDREVLPIEDYFLEKK
jgi:tetratricopeptide (TPR) repeat protein